MVKSLMHSATDQTYSIKVIFFIPQSTIKFKITTYNTVMWQPSSKTIVKLVLPTINILSKEQSDERWTSTVSPQLYYGLFFFFFTFSRAEEKNQTSDIYLCRIKMASSLVPKEIVLLAYQYLTKVFPIMEIVLVS